MTTVIPFVREGLGNSSYLLQVGEGEAALIDPDRSVDRYLDTAASQGWKISAVFETHLHADFVSGALETSHATGAPVYLPEQAQAQFPHTAVQPGRGIQLGNTTVESISSPGHTPEHVSFLFGPNSDAPALFSGGSLIVGGASRTDLISEQMTEPLTRAQYRTLKTAFSLLTDNTRLFPTHGAGSF